MRTLVGVKIAAGLAVAVAMLGSVELMSRHLLTKRYGGWILEIEPDAVPTHDPDLGWCAVAGHQDRDRYGDGRHVTIDARGFRRQETITSTVPAGRYRVVCAGDSFTFGAGVGDDESFPARLQAADPRLQTVNLGLGGYGVDQAVLRYERDGRTLEHDLALFAFIEDDFRRMKANARARPRAVRVHRR